VRLDQGPHRIRVPGGKLGAESGLGRLWRPAPAGSIASSEKALRQAGAAGGKCVRPPPRRGGAYRRRNVRHQNSTVTHADSGRTVTFGRLPKIAAKMTAPVDVKLKKPGDWKLAGTPRRRLDVSIRLRRRRLCDRRAAAGHALRRHRAMPGFSGRAQVVTKLDCGMNGVRRNRAICRCGACVADSWWRAKRRGRGACG